VTVQITLATALLISAGLFLKSLVNVSRVELGVEVDDVLTFSISPERSGYDSSASAALFRRIEEALAQQPGITGVTTAMVPLLAGSNWGTSVSVQGFAQGPDVDNNSRFNEVGPGYFSMLGIPLLAGREFTAGDALGGPRVAVVNEAFAAKFGLGRNPVGSFMSFRGPDSLNIEIVGLAQNAKYSSVKDSVPPLFFIPWRQDTRVGFLNFYARTPLDPAPQMRAVADLVKRLAPTVPVEDLKTMPDQIRENVFLDRLISILSAMFASLATLLAAVGLYGVLAYTVQQRTREIGVRMALGADAGRVRLLIVGQMGVMIAIGAVLGTAAALGLGRLLRSLLYRLEGHDPAVFVASLVVLAGVATVAAYVPVRRASRIDPVQALRYE
jgi:predicted permease